MAKGKKGKGSLSARKKVAAARRAFPPALFHSGNSFAAPHSVLHGTIRQNIRPPGGSPAGGCLFLRRILCRNFQRFVAA